MIAIEKQGKLHYSGECGALKRTSLLRKHIFLDKHFTFGQIINWQVQFLGLYEPLLWQPFTRIYNSLDLQTSNCAVDSNFILFIWFFVFSEFQVCLYIFFSQRQCMQIFLDMVWKLQFSKKVRRAHEKVCGLNACSDCRCLINRTQTMTRLVHLCTFS